MRTTKLHSCNSSTKNTHQTGSLCCAHWSPGMTGASSSMCVKTVFARRVGSMLMGAEAHEWHASTTCAQWAQAVDGRSGRQSRHDKVTFANPYRVHEQCRAAAKHTRQPDAKAGCPPATPSAGEPALGAERDCCPGLALMAARQLADLACTRTRSATSTGAGGWQILVTEARVIGGMASRLPGGWPHNGGWGMAATCTHVQLTQRPRNTRQLPSLGHLVAVAECVLPTTPHLGSGEPKAV